MQKLIIKGKIKITIIDIPCHTLLQEQIVKKYTIKTGKINSAVDKPNQIALNAFPLDFSKYLEIAVEDVWLIKPWPENLIKNIPTPKINILLINEKNKVDINNNIITKNE